MSPLILHTILFNNTFRGWKCEKLTTQSEQYCAEGFVESVGRCRFSSVSTAGTISTHSVIFLYPLLYFSGVLVAYNVSLFQKRVLWY